MKLYNFYADWCSPCIALSATLNSIDDEVVKSHVSVNIESDFDEARKQRVMTVPTLILVGDDGYELRRMTGNKSKAEILRFIYPKF